MSLEAKYRFVLVNDQTGESADLNTKFVSDFSLEENGRLPTIRSFNQAIYDALRTLGHSVKVVKNDLDNNES